MAGRGWRAWVPALGIGTLLLGLGCQIAPYASGGSPSPSPTAARATPTAGRGPSPAPPTATPRGATPTVRVLPTTAASPPHAATASPSPAQQLAPSPPAGAPTFGPAATALPGRPGGAAVVLRGELRRVAASARVLLVAVDGQGDQEISLAPQAALRHADGRPAQLGELRPGDRLELRAQRTGPGALVAEELTVLASGRR
jgi:hypothetical protein